MTLVSFGKFFRKNMKFINLENKLSRWDKQKQNKNSTQIFFFSVIRKPSKVPCLNNKLIVTLISINFWVRMSKKQLSLEKFFDVRLISLTAKWICHFSVLSSYALCEGTANLVVRKSGLYFSGQNSTVRIGKLDPTQLGLLRPELSPTRLVRHDSTEFDKVR